MLCVYGGHRNWIVSDVWTYSISLLLIFACTSVCKPRGPFETETRTRKWCVFCVMNLCFICVYVFQETRPLFFSLSPKHKFQLCPTFQLFTTYPPLGWPVRSVYSKLSHQIITMVAIIVILWCESVEYTASLTNLEMRHKDVPTQLWWRTFCLKYSYGWSVWWTTGNQQHLFARH